MLVLILIVGMTACGGNPSPPPIQEEPVETSRQVEENEYDFQRDLDEAYYSFPEFDTSSYNEEELYYYNEIMYMKDAAYEEGNIDALFSLAGDMYALDMWVWEQIENDGGVAVNDNASAYTDNSADFSSFDIRGTWKNIGTTGTGQAQPGAIIYFADFECSLYSPRDTYAFYKDEYGYRIDATGLLGGTLSYRVVIVDNDNIILDPDTSYETILWRVN